MKALSIRQPWAWLIVNGHKDIENRSWSTSYRGRVLVHASKGMTAQEYEWAYAFALAAGGVQLAHLMPRPSELQRGGVVGAVTITDCVRPEDRASRWHIEGAFGFQLADARPTPFVQCNGALNFFDIPRDAANALRALVA